MTAGELTYSSAGFSAPSVDERPEKDLALADGGGESSRSVLGRAFALLQAFSMERPVLSLGDLAGCANLPKSTTHRLAASLVSCGALQRYGDFGYCVGSWLHDVGMLAPSRFRLMSAAAPFLHELHERTRGTVHLAVSSPGGPLYLDKVSHHGGAAVLTRPGSHFPAHSTALGKCLLAFSDESRNEILRQPGYRRYTQRTLVLPQQLAKDLARVRAEQLGRDQEETVPGLSCIGAPILNRNGVCIAAMSVCVPTVQLNERLMSGAVRRAALGIGRSYTAPA
jgi:DNA-binding IclR family transcriptional regulator